MSIGVASQTGPRSQALLKYLTLDPSNQGLLEQAASAAFEEGELPLAKDLLDRLVAIAPLTPSQSNLAGLVAISDRRFEDAVEVFANLVTEYPQDAGLRFNLAWAKSMLGDFEGVAQVLDPAATSAMPTAAALKIQALHHLGRLDEALAEGQTFEALHPADKGLMSALAVVAIDADAPDLARRYAEMAGDSHEGLSALGMLDLDSGNIQSSLALFQRALLARPDSARGLLGMGLGLMAQGQTRPAADFLDRGAAAFGDHLGTWVAAGWAYFAVGDYRSSRARFETALALDDTFAETHGGLAVLDVMEEQLESARRRTEIALRLDRRCLAAALAKSLILAREGDVEAAQRIQQIALNTPIGENGETIVAAAVRMGLSSPKRGSE